MDIKKRYFLCSVFLISFFSLFFFLKPFPASAQLSCSAPPGGGCWTEQATMCTHTCPGYPLPCGDYIYTNVNGQYCYTGQYCPNGCTFVRWTTDSGTQMCADYCGSGVPSPTPRPTSPPGNPNCDTNIQCSGACQAPPNTCSQNNGTQSNCTYTATTTGRETCNRVAAPNQSCTINACQAPTSCQNGQCRSTTGGGCSNQQPCADGNQCVDGICVEQCTSDNQCNGGQVCLNNECQPPGGCHDDTECETGQVCDSGVCVETCGTDSECSFGQICLNSECTPPPGTGTPRPTTRPTPTGVRPPTPTRPRTPTPTRPRTPTPTRPSTPTPTRRPTPTTRPTPTPVVFRPDMCHCDGITATKLVPGQKATVTAYTKIIGVDNTVAIIKNTNFALAKDATIIMVSGPRPDVVASYDTKTQTIRYKADWMFTVPTAVDKNSIYRIFVDPANDCKDKRLAAATSQTVVLGETTSVPLLWNRIEQTVGGILSAASPSPTPVRKVLSATTQNPQLHMDAFYAADVIETSCSFIKYQFKDIN